MLRVRLSFTPGCLFPIVVHILPLFLLAAVFTSPASAQTAATSPGACRVESTVFEGWQAKIISNPWVKLVIVPQLGGRVMQVMFDGHAYLFVNPKYKGQYFPPAGSQEKGRWFNYGGDKIWPLPEGTQDDHHWPGPVSDVLDDGEYRFQVLSEGLRCTIRLEGPPDERTGLQYSREITLGADSPEIKSHSMMTNSSHRQIEWSLQTVTQYDTSDANKPEGYNREFWAFAPANPHSAYLESFHVRAGLADDPSYSVSGGWFRLHWLPLMNEVWMDSREGWIAIADGTSRFAMIERFTFHPDTEYPGKASVIFYKNGSSLGLDQEGQPALSSSHSDVPPRYLEAELNSPMVSLAPGQTYAMDTVWYPVRAGRDLSAVTNSGVTCEPLAAHRTGNGIRLTGTFGIFFEGTLKAQLFDRRNVRVATVELLRVDPRESVSLEKEIKAPVAADRVTLRLVDVHGVDRGAIASTHVQPALGSL